MGGGVPATTSSKHDAFANFGAIFVLLHGENFCCSDELIDGFMMYVPGCAGACRALLIVVRRAEVVPHLVRQQERHQAQRAGKVLVDANAAAELHSVPM